MQRDSFLKMSCPSVQGALAGAWQRCWGFAGSCVTPRTSCIPLFFDKYVNSGIKNCGVGDFNFWKYLSNVFTLENQLVKNVDMESSRKNINIIIMSILFSLLKYLSISWMLDQALNVSFSWVLTCKKVMLPLKLGSSFIICAGFLGISFLPTLLGIPGLFPTLLSLKTSQLSILNHLW